MKDKIERGILKLSGELFSGDNGPIGFNQYDSVANQLIEIRKRSGIQLAVVVGGGNIFRGRQADNRVDDSEADFMGMMATILNGIGLREALTRNGAKDTRLMTSIEMPEIAEPYILMKGRHHLESGRVVIIAGGLGKPGFSTDSAVAQYAGELRCDIIFKASTVNGVYDCDPKKDVNARKFQTITPHEAMTRRLAVMDGTAFAMVETSGIPIFVFNITDLARLPEAIRGDYSFGTLIEK